MMKTLRLLPLLLASTLTAACATVADDPDTSTSTDEVATRPDFELWKDQGGQWRFALQARNGEALVQSEGYTTRTAAINGVLSVLANGESAAAYELRTAANGEHYFNLRAANRQVIATSETYATAAGARAGVDATVGAVGDYLEAWDGATGARVDVFQGRDLRFYFDVRARNGAVVLTSQGYDTHAAAINGAFSVADHGVAATAYRVVQAVDGRWYFNVHASNGQVIGTSQMYATKWSAERGRDALIALLPAIDLL